MARVKAIILAFGFLLLAREIALGQDPAMAARIPVEPTFRALAGFNLFPTVVDSTTGPTAVRSLAESATAMDVLVPSEAEPDLESASFLEDGVLITPDAWIPAENREGPAFSLPSWDSIGWADSHFQEQPKAPQETESPHKSFSGYFNEHFSGSAWSDVWKDYLTQTPIILPVALSLGAAGVAHWDHPMERHFEGKLGRRDWIGDASAFTVGIGAVGLGLFFPGEGRTGWDSLWNCGEALGATEGLTSIIKRVVLRKRPGSSVAGASFPSGHASIGFAAATLIENNSGDALGIPAYLLATITGLSRIDAGDHFPSDVLAGAALGTLVAGVVDALHFGTGRQSKGICGSHVDVKVGMLSEGGWGVTATLEF